MLVIDDEEDVLNVLEKRLSGQGYVILKASKGREAVEIDKKEISNLIVLDILMPDMDGGDITQALKKDEMAKDIPVILLSCLYTKKDEAEKGHLAGKNFLS